MGDGHVLGLALAVQATVGLLVEFQRPRGGEPDQHVPAGLQVQPMVCRCRVDQSDRYLPAVLRREVGVNASVQIFHAMHARTTFLRR